MSVTVGERKSKRSRRGRCALTVSSIDLLSQLKAHIAEALDIHPRNSAVYACQEGVWTLLEGDDQTLRGEYCKLGVSILMLFKIAPHLS